MSAPYTHHGAATTTNGRVLDFGNFLTIAAATAFSETLPPRWKVEVTPLPSKPAHGTEAPKVAS